MQFVADLKFRCNDAELERLYSEYKKAKANLQGYLMGEGIDFGLELERKQETGENLSAAREAAVDTKKNSENWISITLPENCPNVCLSFKKEVAEMQIEKFGASPLYGFGNEKEDWLPEQIFITYGGSLAPKQRRPEE